MAKRRRTVSVSRQVVTALEEPRFLIELDGKLYLTAAVLEYDPNHPKINKGQAAMIGDLQGHMERGDQVRAVHFSADGMGQEVLAANMVMR
jgi:hypothetical protein